MGTDGRKDTGQEVELIRHKRVDLRKVLCACIQFFLNPVIEHDQILDDGRLLLEQKTKRFSRCGRFVKNPFLDNGIHIGGGQGQARIKAALDLGEIPSLHPRDGINILLARHNDPGAPLALASKILSNRLQVQHEVAVLADVLADLVHKKNNVLVLALAVQIGTNALCKIVNADGVGFRRFLAPVAGGGLAHKSHRRKRIHNAVLNKVEVLARFFPGRAVLVLKRRFELLVASILGQLTLQIRHMGHGTAKAQFLVEHPQEHIHDGILVLLSIGLALGIDVEQDNIRRCLSRKAHIGQHHRVMNLLILHEVVKRSFIANALVPQDVGEDFQKVRFTTPEKTGDPYSHFRSRSRNPLLICRKEIPEMLFQFPRDNIFLQLLRYIRVITLAHDDDALNFTIYLFRK